MDSFLRCCLPRRQALSICRATLYAMTGFLVCFLFFSPAASVQTVYEQHSVTEIVRAKQFENANRAQAQVYIDPQAGRNDPGTKSVSWTKQSQPPRNPEWHSQVESLNDADRNIYESVQRIPSLMPDEIRMKALLSPYLDSSEKHLRDVALRTRAFKEAFAFWESLHLVEVEGSILQQDVVQRLRAIGLPSPHLREAIAAYDGFRAYMNQFAARLFPWIMKYQPDHMALHASFYRGGRGIALTTGDKQAPYLLTSIPSFRKLGCDLPIEILYLGDGDLSEENRELLEALPNVITRDLSQMIDDEGWALHGWAAKPFAILMSSFREVLFIDADALFFSNPEALFEDEQYLNTGALFFKDRNLSPEDKRAWLRDVLPKPISHHVKKNRFWTGESGHMQDSGALVIDKWRHFVSLLLVTRLNGPDRDGDESAGKRGVYDMIYGDKESFWLSWEMAADLDYAFHDGATGSMGVIRNPENERVKTKELDGLLQEIRSHLIHPSHTESDEKVVSSSSSAGAHHPTAEPATEKPSICTPQLLHFDRGGKPLWFNGWLHSTKDDSIKYMPFEVYMKEPKRIAKSSDHHTVHPWTIHEGNVVCLESEEYSSFTDPERKFLNELVESAKNVSETVEMLP